MDEIDLPPMPLSQLSFSRKRARPDYEPATSSDPALFSSDEHTPSAETYISKRRKDIWAGTWWGSRTHEPMKRTFRRNYDSGIYMGSEGTEAESGLEDELLRDMEQKQQETFEHNRRKFQRLPDFSEVALEKLPRPILLSPLQHQVRGIIQKCLEDGKEDVDLSSMSLDSLPPDVASLKSITRHSALPQILSYESEDAGTYASIEANLRLYLANNAFTRIPSLVLDLTNLRFLSFRQNNLDQIGPGIRELKNLVTLNIAGNCLTQLPFEVLQLVQTHSLQEIIADRNPWMEIPDTVRRVQEATINPRSKGIFSTRTAISTASLFRPNGTTDRSAQDACPSSPDMLYSESRSPGLAELALRRISKLQGLANLDDWLLEDLPETVTNMLIKARDSQLDGGRTCTTCGQKMMVPRKQWVEWWRLTNREDRLGQVIPFLQLQCHAQCQGIAERPRPSPFVLPSRPAEGRFDQYREVH